MTNHALLHDFPPTTATVAGAIDLPAPATETVERQNAKQKMGFGFGFGFGGKPNCPLFIVNPEADPASINDFTSNTEAALDELLNEAVLHGGVDGGRAWLVEMLIHATRATAQRACSRA